jgi:hypothetical protein
MDCKPGTTISISAIHGLYNDAFSSERILIFWIQGRPKTWHTVRRARKLAGCYAIEALAAAAAVSWLAFIAVSAARHGPITLIAERSVVLSGPLLRQKHDNPHLISFSMPAHACMPGGSMYWGTFN